MCDILKCTTQFKYFFLFMEFYVKSDLFQCYVLILIFKRIQLFSHFFTVRHCNFFISFFAFNFYWKLKCVLICCNFSQLNSSSLSLHPHSTKVFWRNSLIHKHHRCIASPCSEIISVEMTLIYEKIIINKKKLETWNGFHWKS